MIAALLTACTVPWSPPPATQGPFPHPDGYDVGSVHGPDALASDAPCAECHRTDDCAECHASYPHPAISPAAVHPEPTAECLDCHATPGAYAAANVPCTSCHPSYPHVDGFADPGQHGVYALARGRIDLVCGTCHGADLSGGVVNVACNRCHPDWPHPTDWEVGHQATTEDQLRRCGTCHGFDGSGGNAGVACDTCHVVIPHPDGWIPGGHAAAVSVQSDADCLLCHDPGDGPPGMFAPCGGTCHGGVP